jgi:hypothetical protein
MEGATHADIDMRGVGHARVTVGPDDATMERCVLRWNGLREPAWAASMSHRCCVTVKSVISIRLINKVASQVKASRNGLA